MDYFLPIAVGLFWIIIIAILWGAAAVTRGAAFANKYLAVVVIICAVPIGIMMLWHH